jgi:pentatricopeptide repeat protein
VAIAARQKHCRNLTWPTWRDAHVERHKSINFMSASYVPRLLSRTAENDWSREKKSGPISPSFMFHFDFLLSINFLPFNPLSCALIYSLCAMQYEEKATAYFRQMKKREGHSSGSTYRIRGACVRVCVCVCVCVCVRVGG